MVNWTLPMEQTYEFFLVDPVSWTETKRLNNVRSCNISRDDESDTLASASISCSEMIGEAYVRVYLITVQNGIRERHPLGTFIIQTPSVNTSGKSKDIVMEGYSPLLELNENPPPLGYFTPKGENVLDYAYRLTRENMRGPVVKATNPTILYYDFVADVSDKWNTYISDLIANAKFKLGLDEMSRVIFVPDQDVASLRPVWTYTDDNASILYPDISTDFDLYKVPNVVEVIYSNGKDNYYARKVNDDKNSPTSTIARGREIVYRETDPDIIGNPGQAQIEEYAVNLLRQKSTFEHTVTYTHGYCPVRVGDCVRINSAKAGLDGVKAKVIRQSISCTAGCPVTETAKYTTKLWG